MVPAFEAVFAAPYPAGLLCGCVTNPSLMCTMVRAAHGSGSLQKEFVV